MWAVLKADAYGHGAPAVARTLERRGADGFCVALLEEAVELREAGIIAPDPRHGRLLRRARTTRSSRAGSSRWSTTSGRSKRSRGSSAPATASGPIDVHLKIDTGMARLGVTMHALPAVAARLADFPEVRVRGSDDPPRVRGASPTWKMTAEQMARFDEATALLARQGVRVEFATRPTAPRSCEEARLDAVRPGIALFGVSPRLEDQPLTRELSP